MTTSASRCDQIIALIDACLADLEVIERPARVLASSSMSYPFTSSPERNS